MQNEVAAWIVWKRAVCEIALPRSLDLVGNVVVLAFGTWISWKRAVCVVKNVVAPAFGAWISWRRTVCDLVPPQSLDLVEQCGGIGFWHLWY